MSRGSNSDRWLERFRNISQIILVVVAIFGYFYTVRPIYRNQLLSEELSRKTFEMREKEQAISQLDSKRIALKRANVKLQEDNENIAKEIQIYKKKSIQLKNNIMDLLLNNVEINMVWRINNYIVWKKDDKKIMSYVYGIGPIEKIGSSYIKQQSKEFPYLRILHEDDQKEIINFINSYIDKNKEQIDIEINKLYNLETPIIAFSMSDVLGVDAKGDRAVSSNNYAYSFVNLISQFGLLSKTMDDNKEKVSIKNPLHEIFVKIKKEYEIVNKK